MNDMLPQDAQASPSPDQNKAATGIPSPDLYALWTYKGYQLDSGDFTTSMVHLYRAELSRANAWRGRLDVTTNWAMIATGAALSFAFSQPDVHHSVILLNLVLATVFLFIEARRYRYYELWSQRVRLMETNFFAALLEPPFRPNPEWAQSLAQSLLRPRFAISLMEAASHRLRRNYVWIFLVLELAWVAKLLLYPQGDTVSAATLLARARLGVVPGWAVFGGVLVFNLVLLSLIIWSARLQRKRDDLE